MSRMGHVRLQQPELARQQRRTRTPTRRTRRRARPPGCDDDAAAGRPPRSRCAFANHSPKPAAARTMPACTDQRMRLNGAATVARRASSGDTPSEVETAGRPATACRPARPRSTSTDRRSSCSLRSASSTRAATGDNRSPTRSSHASVSDARADADQDSRPPKTFSIMFIARALSVSWPVEPRLAEEEDRIVRDFRMLREIRGQCRIGRQVVGLVSSDGSSRSTWATDGGYWSKISRSRSRVSRAVRSSTAGGAGRLRRRVRGAASAPASPGPAAAAGSPASRIIVNTRHVVSSLPSIYAGRGRKLTCCRMVMIQCSPPSCCSWRCSPRCAAQSPHGRRHQREDPPGRATAIRRSCGPSTC